MEEEKNEYIDNDINAIMTRFFNFRMRYMEDRKKLREKEGIVLAQQEQIRLSREAEGIEKRKARDCERALKQQQDIVDNFLGVKEENVALTAEVKQLRSDKAELIAKMEENDESWQRSVEKLIQTHQKEVEDLKVFSERKARDARADLDMFRAEYDMKRKDMEGKFLELQKEKRAELELTSRICDEKLRDMEDHINTALYNHDQARKDSTAAITMYKQKVIDLERKLMHAEIESRRKMAPPPGYRYNNNYQLPAQPQPQPATILKKPAAWRPELAVRGGAKPASNYTAAGAKGKGGNSSIQPLDFVDETGAEENTKKVTFAGPKKRKLYNPNQAEF